MYLTRYDIYNYPRQEIKLKFNDLSESKKGHALDNPAFEFMEDLSELTENF